MKPILKTYFAFLFLILLSSSLMAQITDGAVEMDDVMKTNGKIYVVVTVLAVVFAGIIAFLVSIDRKVSKLEKQINEKKNSIPGS